MARVAKGEREAGDEEDRQMLDVVRQNRHRPPRRADQRERDDRRETDPGGDLKQTPPRHVVNAFPAPRVSRKRSCDQPPRSLHYDARSGLQSLHLYLLQNANNSSPLTLPAAGNSARRAGTLLAASASD